MNELNKLISLCKAGVYVEANRHKDFYQSVKEHMENAERMSEGTISDTGEDVYVEMIKRDTVICVQFYPDTPIGSYSIYHYDVDEALKIALSVLN